MKRIKVNEMEVLLEKNDVLYIMCEDRQRYDLYFDGEKLVMEKVR